MFPLGDVTDKSQVRDAAAALGLAVHDKPDSQEICFVPGNDYKTLIRERRPDLRQPGEIRDQGGKVLGKHDGYTSFTIGQRRGLGVAAGLPIYVTAIDPGTNTVTVGERDDLLSGGLVAARMNWHADPPPDWADVEIKIRHMHKAAGGRVRGTPRGSAEAVFDHAQSAVTPGQAAVFYQGGLVLGGGWIEESVSPDDSLPRST